MMDLSKSFSVVPRSHAPVQDLAKKPEWYHRRPASPHLDAPCRTRAMLRPDAGVEPGSYSNASLSPGLYRDGVHGDLWCSGFYGADDMDSSGEGEEDSASSSDVIVLLSTSKQPLMCAPFVADGVRHVVESAAASSPGFCRQGTALPSSPSRESSSSEESSDSSGDIPPHHARPVVLLSDLSSVYADSAYSRVDASSDDSDVVEVPVTKVTLKRQNISRQRRNLENAEQIEAPPTEGKRSGRISKCPVFSRLPRHRLTRRAKKDAVGIYYESCDSGDVMTYALRSSSSDEARPPAAAQCAEAPPPSKTKAEPQGDCQTPLAAHRRTPTKPREVTAKRSGRGKGAGRAAAAALTRRRAVLARFSPPPAPIKVRDSKQKRRSSDIFCPFVRVQDHLCTVVNHKEDQQDGRLKDQTSNAASSGFLPKTSCFRLARHVAAGASPATPLCYLCGHVTNARGLGDLHGPYYPDHVPRTSQGGEEERWIHEDCGAWSAGVFLVRGKLYGLEEAASATRHTVCSLCQRPGAIMGCSQKGCTHSYHYTCARHTGCVLNEDNFSMRCRQHHMTQHSQHQRHMKSELWRATRRHVR
ncbi:uncharacterized protein [Nerophis lumbriciformis]|uniref:uncharacterized protein n=1 Tax=Nerophis lumbriciformis TaxID=546530 RepID=UPI002ADF05A7|nr:uncharacterized protein LOC133620205 [Nerophis lumbriciformis]XP_061837475.1 uncharacterized protein LOC133620205 [Nerophis lumbriciformis]XP_061837476.1 uncharacterized protein LOC133620205 [Nerophis lumbriciformis]